MSQTLTLEELYQKSLSKLSNKLEEDASFRLEFNNDYEFYKQRFWNYLKARPEQKEFVEQFFPYYQFVYLQGYFLAEQFVNDENIDIPNEFFIQPNGLIRQQMGQVLGEDQAFLEEITSAEITADFEVWVSQNYEVVEELVYETKKEIALIGAYARFIDERQSRGVKEQEQPKTAQSGIIHRSDTAYFIDPQKYLVALYSAKANERWALLQWSNNGNNNEIGSVMVQSYIEKDMKAMIQQLPTYENQSIESLPKQAVFITLILDVEIPQNELTYMANTLYYGTKHRNPSADEIQIQIIETNNVFYFTPDQQS